MPTYQAGWLRHDRSKVFLHPSGIFVVYCITRCYFRGSDICRHLGTGGLLGDKFEDY